MAEDKAIRTTNVKQFQHEALPDAARQIRLLKRKLMSHGNDLEFTLSTHHLDEAPAFSAISYAWGDALSMRRIVVNDHAFESQDDLQEKSVQVARMGSIFSTATHVLSCIGEHDEASCVIEKALDRVSVFYEGEKLSDFKSCPGWRSDRLRWYRTPYRDSDHWEDHYEDRYEVERAFLLRFRESFAKFAARPYWARLWIIQEVLSGKDRAEICYGDRRQSWQRPWRLADFMVTEGVHMHVESHPRLGGPAEPLPPLIDLCLLASRVTGNRCPLTISELLGLARHHHCANTLDILYGVLSCIGWPESLPLLVVDYSSSSSELACKVMQLWLADEANYMSGEYLKFPQDLCEVFAVGQDNSPNSQRLKSQVRLTEFREHMAVLRKKKGELLEDPECDLMSLCGRPKADWRMLRSAWEECDA